MATPSRSASEASSSPSITIYGQIILQGHKVILSACSPYFKKILRDNPCRHPVLILNDMDLEVEILPNFFHLPTYLGYLPTYLPTYLPNWSSVVRYLRPWWRTCTTGRCLCRRTACRVFCRRQRLWRSRGSWTRRRRRAAAARATSSRWPGFLRCQSSQGLQLFHCRFGYDIQEGLGWNITLFCITRLSCALVRNVCQWAFLSSSIFEF